VLRVHVAGDFYSADYATKRLGVMRAMPMVAFFFYTRSWRAAATLAVLAEMALLRNVRAWFSCDAETGVPSDVPTGVRLAWLQSAADELPSRADLVFRVRRLRSAALKQVECTDGPAAPVCPVENGTPGERADCGRCGVCWRPARGGEPARTPLPIVS